MPLKTIGTGLSRTGATSTRTAIEQLGLEPCHHMMELFANPEQVAIWMEVAQNGASDRNTVVDGYSAQIDFPGGRVWQQTIQPFPDAKVIHTERPEDA